MFLTVFLFCVITLLCYIVIHLGLYKHKLNNECRSRKLEFHSFFLASFFLHVAFMTISRIGSTSVVATPFLSFFKSIIWPFDFTIGAFAQMGELSFLWNCITAILFTSAACSLVAEHQRTVTDIRPHKGDKKQKNDFEFVVQESKEIVTPYIDFCRILS